MESTEKKNTFIKKIFFVRKHKFLKIFENIFLSQEFAKLMEIIVINNTEDVYNNFKIDSLLNRRQAT